MFADLESSLKETCLFAPSLVLKVSVTRSQVRFGLNK